MRLRRGGGMKKSAGLTLARRLLYEKITAANKFFCSVKTFFCTFVRRIAANSSAIGVKIRTDFRRRKTRRLFPPHMTTQTEQIGSIIPINSGLSSAQTLAIENGANYVVIQPYTQDVFVTTDGTTPSATNGTKVTAGTLARIDVFHDRATQIVGTVVKVKEATASATLNYYSEKLRQPSNWP